MNEHVNRKILKASGWCAVIFGICLALLGVLELIVFALSGHVEYIDAGNRWDADGGRYAVMTMYAEDGAGISADQAGAWDHAMETALLESSVTPPEGGRSWTSCYAAETELRLYGPKGDTTAQTMAVGGDFFLFHPMTFTYGSYFRNDPSNPMGVVLDRELAWKVFGAENIIGMPVSISGQEFVVTGVVEKESQSGMYAHTYGTRPRMYMSYAGYQRISEAASDITMYEAVLPNAVKAFAKNIFNNVVHVNEETAEVQEASARFSVSSRIENMKKLPYSWIRPNKIGYPYWENEARVYDYHFAVLMIFELIFVTAAVVTMLLSFILLRVSGYTVTDTVKNTWHTLEARQKKRPPHKPKKEKKTPRTSPEQPADAAAHKPKRRKASRSVPELPETNTLNKNK